MRPTAILALLTLTAPAPLVAQGIVLPVRCARECPARGAILLDSVKVWANLQRGRAATYVDHVVRNATADTVEGAFFFPVPAGAEVDRVWVRKGSELELYNEWTRPEEARLLLDGFARSRPRAGLGAYAGARVVHVRVPPMAPGEVKHLQVAFDQPLRPVRGAVTWRYPLSTAAAVSPIGHLDLGLEVRTPAGFVDLRSPSHRVRTQLGMESGRCGPRERCGTRGYPSRRVRVVRLEHAPGVRRRDFELVYTPADSTAATAARSWIVEPLDIREPVRP